jgi:uncharacterized DUF497 family protein
LAIPKRSTGTIPSIPTLKCAPSALGTSLAGRILIVSYTLRKVNNAKEIIRIISARQATRKERQAYAG